MSVENADDYIDSRDVIDNIEELEADIGDNESPDDFVLEREELAKLREFDAQGRDLFEEWDEGVTLINENYWSQYVEEMAYDRGWVDTDSFIFTYVDWERLANDLLIDRTVINFDGVDYYGIWY